MSSNSSLDNSSSATSDGSTMNNFSHYRNVSSSLDEMVEKSYVDDSEEILETDSNSEDEIIRVVKKKTNIIQDSSDDDEDEKKAVFSPRTRRSIHGFPPRVISSDEEEISSETEDEEYEAITSEQNLTNQKSYVNVNENENNSIYPLNQSSTSNNISNRSLNENDSLASLKDFKTKNRFSSNFDSSIVNKLSSTITGTPKANEEITLLSFTDNEKTRNSKGSTTYDELQIVSPTIEKIIELSSESDSTPNVIASTPTIVDRKKEQLQSKITAYQISPKSSKPSKFTNPQFVSKEALSRELRKLDELNSDLSTCQNLMKINANLPDGGNKMIERIEKCKLEIKKQANYVANLVVDENEIRANRSAGIDTSSEDPSRTSKNKFGQGGIKAPTWEELSAATNAILPKYTGTQGLANFAAQKAITVDRLKDIHGSLETCPDETVLEKTPKGINIELMDHQKHALAWMQWREKQRPHGGILADDMGLGKTLTMIALIVAQKENLNETEEEEEESEDEENSAPTKGWTAKGRKDYYDGGTLVVCPASLLKQWEAEVKNRTKRNILNITLHHGTNRDAKPRHLAKYDIVITTYHIASREAKTNDTLFRIKWNRIILDEAHMIRNHKAQISIGVCNLKGKNRWALTGTPVHNKETDLYAVIKFLKCTPFDSFPHWKKWIDNKTDGGLVRLNTLIKSLLLRRTKVQLQEEGGVFKLPEKITELIEVNLDTDEMNVYQKVMTYSQKLFAEFLYQRAEKKNDLFYGNELNAPTYKQIKDPNGAYFKAHKKMAQINQNTEVKSFQILVLLLRLRQICCHPCLINSMLQDEDANPNSSSEGEHSTTEVDLLRHLENLNINENSASGENLENSKENAIARGAAKVLLKSNPVYDSSRASAKFNRVLELVNEKLKDTDDKGIIVSQWSSLLVILEKHLMKKGYRCVSLNGTVPIKNRNDIVTSFNDKKSKTQIMLLSLTAGGVGLNLVGANHLFLIDLHWNPQLESQAQDRIYRVGQEKTVYIYKFMVKDTVEEKIKCLQEKKLEIANGVLTGVKSEGSKLTMEDLKGLFGL